MSRLVTGREIRLTLALVEAASAADEVLTELSGVDGPEVARAARAAMKVRSVEELAGRDLLVRDIFDRYADVADEDLPDADTLVRV